MKKLIFTLGLVLFALTVNAQWVDNGNNLITTDNLGIGTTNPDYKLDIEENKENGILYRHLTTAGMPNSGNRTWTFKIGRNYDYPNRTIEFGMISQGYGTNPSFYVETPNRFGNVATFLTTNTVDDSNEHNWSIRLGREYDYPNRTLDFGMVSDAHGTNPAFYVAPKGIEVFRITESGKVGIGTADFSGDHKLRVEGSIGAREIKVEASGWSDFVFEKDYKLRTLEEVEKHIVEKGHLPEIPNETEVTKNGINLGEMNAKLLQKIEELTLYMIDINNQVKELKSENKELKEKVSSLENE